MTIFAVTVAAIPAYAQSTTYGTIVIDDDVGVARGNGDYAVGQGPAPQEARRVAMSNCTAGGNVACTVRVTYQRCGAYASSRQTFGTGIGEAMAQAASAALSACGDKACHLVVADCVDTPLRPPPYPFQTRP